jgi:sulfite reductase (NADPH) hemoprotein beta-component
MLTANRLVDGDVLYWKSGGWVPALAEGEVFAEPADADAALVAAKAFVARNVVVAPYLFDMRTDAKGIHPVKEREIIRAAGPTVHPHTGKQAGQFQNA